MYGRASDNMQSRTRRAADAMDQTGGIAASDAFKPEVARSVAADEIFRLTLAVQEAQSRLTRINARLGQRHPERARAVVAFQEASLALSRVKGRAKAEASLVSADRDKRWERAFVAVAKQMLAGPVFDRLVTAAHHRMGEDA